MSRAVRIGVVGCGNALRESYRRALDMLRAAGRIEPVVACGRQASAGEEMLSSRFGFARYTTDHRAVTEADDVDLVLITTSNQAHGAIARDALLAGKHVLVEKPMSTSLAEAAELVELARTSAGYLVPAPYVILSPTFRRIWRHIRSGDIGRPLSGRAMYGWAGPDWGQWFYRPGGGSMLDLGIYNVVALTGLLGPASRVTGLVGTAIKERVVEGRPMTVEADDNAQICIEFAGDCYAVVTTGFTIQRFRTPGIEVYGSTGTIQMMGAAWGPDGYELWQNDRGAWQVFEEEDPDWRWTDGLRHVVECLETGRRPLIQPDHAYHALEIIEAARQAGRDGRRRRIRSTFTPLELLPEGDDPGVL